MNSQHLKLADLLEQARKSVIEHAVFAKNLANARDDSSIQTMSEKTTKRDEALRRVFAEIEKSGVTANPLSRAADSRSLVKERLEKTPATVL